MRKGPDDVGSGFTEAGSIPAVHPGVSARGNRDFGGLTPTGLTARPDPIPPADLFEYRREIGLDVALEGLREGWRDERYTMDELQRYAEPCYVRGVVRPYYLQVMVPGA